MPPLFRPPREPFVLLRRPPEVVLPEVEPEVLMLPELPEVLMLPELPEVLMLPEVEPLVELPEVEPPVELPEVEPPVLLPVEPVVVCAFAVLANRPKPNKKVAVRSDVKMCFFIKKGKRERKIRLLIGCQHRR